MTKKEHRQQVYEKYGGRCAYTGHVLDHEWQVDHIVPLTYYRMGIHVTDPNAIHNLVPCLKIINHYKRGKDLEEWRRFVCSMHVRLKRVPKCTRTPQTEKRKQYMLKVAGYFGVTCDTPFDGVFYFETLTTIN